ncbi:class I SAM-dependent methyltransferase [Alloyangia pacifica]|uniref:class I SAM-dependent methyltransferase n=1 Tax=Alloyangia pacifica TaxID=311180 RepID=UPI0031E22F57
MSAVPKIEQNQVSSLENFGDHLGKSLIGKRSSWIMGQISKRDENFISGIISYLKPQKVVEVGVASGWSSTVILNAMSQLGAPDGKEDVWLTGVDLSPDYYLDKEIRTGAAVAEIVPDLLPHYRLKTGVFSFQAMPDVGGVDFAFIDAHHAHPWATFDLLSVIPFMSPNSWVALHDINLCTVPRHQHKNRAPYYLYFLWKGPKVHSSPETPMIGAINLPENPRDCFSDVIEILSTPWEVHVPEDLLHLWVEYVVKYYGDAAGKEFMNCCAIANKPTLGRSNA